MIQSNGFCLYLLPLITNNQTPSKRATRADNLPHFARLAV